MPSLTVSSKLAKARVTFAHISSFESLIKFSVKKFGWNRRGRLDICLRATEKGAVTISYDLWTCTTRDRFTEQRVWARWLAHHKCFIWALFKWSFMEQGSGRLNSHENYSTPFTLLVWRSLPAVFAILFLIHLPCMSLLRDVPKKKKGHPPYFQ